MRIKSYFAGSIQSAMQRARREFGDDVMLVTSRAAAAESRHLGDYEVVLAVDEAETTVDGEEIATVAAQAPETAKTPPLSSAFREILSEQIGGGPLPRPIPLEPAAADGAGEAIEAIQSALFQVGIDPPVADALLLLIQGYAHTTVATPPLRPPASLPVAPISAPVSPPPSLAEQEIPARIQSPDDVAAAIYASALQASRAHATAVYASANQASANQACAGRVPVTLARIPEDVQRTGSPYARIPESGTAPVVHRSRAAGNRGAKPGVMMALLALGLFGFTRRSRS